MEEPKTQRDGAAEPSRPPARPHLSPGPSAARGALGGRRHRAGPFTVPAPRPQELELSLSLSLSGLWLPSVREWTRHPRGRFSGGTLFAHLWVYCTPGPGLAELVSGLQGTSKEGETRGEKGAGSTFRVPGASRCQSPACYHGGHREANGRPEERPRVWSIPRCRSW